MRIQIYLGRSLKLPLGYHHILQSALYRALSYDQELGTSVHNMVQNAKERLYKPFCFSQLRGIYKVESGQIIFSKQINLTFSTNDEYLMQVMMKSLRQNGLEIHNQRYDVEFLELKEPIFRSNSVRIKMLSPITVLTTDIATKKMIFFVPGSKEFVDAVEQNYIGKYKQVFGREPSEKLEITPVRLSNKSKYVTRYKNTYITAWNGEFQLKAEPEGLALLYDLGLGAKNAQGFGLFEIV